MAPFTALVPPAVLLSLIAAAPLAASEADPDGALPQAYETWRHPRPVDPALFPGTDDPAGEAASFSDFVSVDNPPDGDGPRDLAFSADGNSVLVAGRDTDNLLIFDFATRTVSAVIDVQDFPVDVAVSPDGLWAAVPNVFSDTVSVIDLGTNTVAAHVPVTGTQPFRVEFTADSALVVAGVVNDGVTSALSVIDVATLSEVRSIPSTPQGGLGFFFNSESGVWGNLFTQFAVSPGGVIVLPDRGGSQVKLYDVTTGATLATLATGNWATAVDISADGTTAVVSHESNINLITEIDLVTRTVTGSFATGSSLSAQAIRITPTKTHAIAAISNNVIFVDLTSGATTATVSTGTVGDIEVSFDGQYAFVSNYNSSVIDLATQSKVATLSYRPSADTAMSPLHHRAVAINNHFGADLHFYLTNGAASSFAGWAQGGPAPEGDAPRTLAVSGDGSTVLIGNNISRNACILDVASGQVQAWCSTGERVLGVGVSPDGSTGVVANADENTVSIIDLATGSVDANLPLFTRPAEVLISPDSQMAYVTTVAGTDRLHFIQLAGASSAVVGSLVSGQMGVAWGYTYGETSGLAQTDDGAVIGVCVSFDDELLLVDAATRTVLTRVPLPSGGFPINAAFSHDGTRAYVLNAFDDSVSVVDVNGAASSLITTVSGIDFPSTVHVDAADAYVYVGNFGSSPAVRVIDTATNAIVRTVTLAGMQPRAAALGASTLHVAASDSGGAPALWRVAATGVTAAVIDSTPLTGTPSDLVFSESLQTAVVCFPTSDGVDLHSFVDVTSYCTGKTTSESCVAYLDFTGTPSATRTGPFKVITRDSIAGTVGLWLYSGKKGAMPDHHGGKLCIKSPFRRTAAKAAKTPSNGICPTATGRHVFDFQNLIQGGSDPSLTAGRKVFVQGRFRDVGDPAGFGDGLTDGMRFTVLP